jgi:hypothetical protein
MRDPLVVPVRCEAPAVAGLLTVDDERIRFEAESGVVFDVPRGSAALAWLRDKGIRRVPRCDVETPEGRFRLSFSRPARPAAPAQRGPSEPLPSAPAPSSPSASPGPSPSRGWSSPPGSASSPFSAVGSASPAAYADGARWAADAVRARLLPPPADGRGPVLTIAADDYRCECAAFSPDGALLAVGKSNGMVGIWDVPAGEPIKHFLHDLLGGPVTAVAFSADGWLLASAGRDGQLKVRNLRTGKLILRRQHPGPLRAVAFDPSADLVATACADGAVRVWTSGGRLVAEQAGACTPATRAVAFTDAGPAAVEEAPRAGRYSAVITPDGSLQIRVLQAG